jgi:hypothetical protein
MKRKKLGKILLSVAPIFGVTGFYPANKCNECDEKKNSPCSIDLKNDNKALEQSKNRCQKKSA